MAITTSYNEAVAAVEKQIAKESYAPARLRKAQTEIRTASKTYTRGNQNQR